MALDMNIEDKIQPVLTSETENETEQKPEGRRNKILLALTNITVEPVLFLFFLPIFISLVALANLDLEKACRVNLQFNKTVCDGLTARNSSMYSKTDEETVQKLVASMNAWKNVIKSVIPSLLLMFLGSWSDRHRRTKPCILLPITGTIVSCVGILICTYFFYELPMEFNGIAESVPTAFTGGPFALIMAVFSYVSSISSVETRTVRVGVINIVNRFSMVLGIVFSGILYKAISLYGVFSLALFMYLLALLYGIFVVQEIEVGTKDDVETNLRKGGFIKDFFDISHVSETIGVAFKSRQKNIRKRICVTMILLSLIIGPVHGELNVMYLFVRYRFEWNDIDFSVYYAYSLVLNILGTVFSLILFSRVLKLDDALLGVISCTSKFLSCFVYAFASNSTVFYLGKINSLFGICEAMTPLVYGPLYNLVYGATIHALPGTFFLVGGAIAVAASLIFLWLYIEHRRDAAEEKHNQTQMKDLLKAQ